MHYVALVMVPDTVDRRNRDAVIHAVSLSMDPFNGNVPDNTEGRWDWWIVGGRWTGLLTGYEPGKDPVNQERCAFCKGTGTRVLPLLGDLRPVPFPEGECNGCGGVEGGHPGIRIKHELAPYAGDVMPVRILLRRLLRDIREKKWTGSMGRLASGGYPIITQDRSWHELPIVRTGATTRFLELLKIDATALAVVVDYHI